MTRIKDEVGNRYGRLLVKQLAESQGDGARWLCLCDCGRETVVIGKSLRSGYTKSCGCWRADNCASIRQAQELPIGKASFNALISQWKHAAKKRGFGWALTKKQVRKLTSQRCHYCGIEPLQVAGTAAHNGAYIYNGLDRVDNSKGYFIENVVPCCGDCNRSKHARDVMDYKRWLRRSYEHWAKYEAEQCPP